LDECHQDADDEADRDERGEDLQVVERLQEKAGKTLEDLRELDEERAQVDQELFEGLKQLLQNERNLLDADPVRPALVVLDDRAARMANGPRANERSRPAADHGC